jgi:hypothetical protein
VHSPGCATKPRRDGCTELEPMMVLLVACIGAGCTSAWIMFMLFGPVPAPRRPLLVPRAIAQGPTTAEASAASPSLPAPDTWLAPTLADLVPCRREARRVAAPILRRPRFDTPPVFEIEECTRVDR